ncbi:hypothetical protein SEA_CRICKO_19 [Streptomyces phage CricKo]|jgi:hypothetical protein|nr:hypothetical protein SEA_RAINYDAI_19 [Streptomyces phage Rainydai]AWN06121.1 hypothetical protein SEA_SENDITCS_18 [Streptomyces phage SendItCS]QJD49902.1 hypothetical protein SEA_CRICKO_19 [Streptomyces phage CricKo]QNL30634.1 hypothetical protein SEA_THIQQUMS_19 [Streptomyces phage Thiqqums]WIC89356.1 hypothetical protein SEA_MIEK_19 [Streptomyces phage Miek]
MGLGYEVNKPILDGKAGEAVLQLRSALDKVEAIATWLANNPVVNEVDPLWSDPFNYTADESYALRMYFSSVDQIRTQNGTLMAVGRKMTGLE